MEITIKEALHRGIEAHKAGKVREADQFYTAILKSQPDHPDANHNMGVLAVGIGKINEAIPYFEKAVKAKEEISQYWVSYIDALLKLDKENEAKIIYEKAIDKGIKEEKIIKFTLRLLASPPCVRASSKDL